MVAKDPEAIGWAGSKEAPLTTLIWANDWEALMIPKRLVNANAESFLI